MLKKVFYSLYVVLVPAFFLFIIFGVVKYQVRMEVERTFLYQPQVIFIVISNLLFGIFAANVLLLKPKNITKRHDVVLYFITAFYLLLLIIGTDLFPLLPSPEYMSEYLFILFALYIYKAVKICMTKNIASEPVSNKS